MYTLRLDSSYKHRLLTEVYSSGSAGKPYLMDCIIDTGCVNTLVDESQLVHLKFTDLNFYQAIKIASKSISGKAVILEQVDFGGLKVNNILVFAAPLVGTPVVNRMLLGLSTLNNWYYNVKKPINVIEFEESQILPLGAGIKNKYTNYFDTHGKYVLIGAN